MVSYESIKHKLKKIGGFEDDTPPSITVVQYIKNNQRSIWPSVS